MNKSVSISLTILCLLHAAVLTGLTSNIQPVKASGDIYIRPDGSIDPEAAKAFIDSVDNLTYFFKRDTLGSIQVERDNMTIDGKGYLLQGPGNGDGITLNARNVNIANLEIRKFYVGVYINSSSSDNAVSGNNITNNDYGVCLMWSDYNTVSGNNITENNDNYGVCLYSSNHNVLSGNNITENNNHGVYMFMNSAINTVSGNNITENNDVGVYLRSSPNNTVSGNNITNNDYGVYICDSSYNTVSGNNITENNRYGVSLVSTSSYTLGNNNSLRDNSITDNKYGFGVRAKEKDGYYQDIDASNTVDGKPIYYWVDKQDMTVPTDAGYVALVNSHNITVQGLILSNNGQGMLLAEATYSNITNNYMIANEKGICLYYSINNSVTRNFFVYNTIQVESINSVNFWNSSYPVGNYWSDYPGADEYGGLNQDIPGSDEIGDTPYVIDQYNNDSYPRFPISDYSLTIIATEGGTTNPPPETYENTSLLVAVTPVPERGYSFDHWVLDGNDNKTSPIIIDMASADHVLQAVFVDNIPPEIGVPEQYPQRGSVRPDEEVTVTTNITDYGTGVKNATMTYKVDNRSGWQYKSMAQDPESLEYQATIEAQPAGTWVHFKIIAFDNNGNNATLDGTSVYCRYHIYLNTDLNGDGKVDVFDIEIVAKAFGCKPADDRWN
jgi:parallel beta-helix repeat protein